MTESKNKITDAHIDNMIKDVVFHETPGTTLTICVLVLNNGFTVVGKSGCVDPANYNKEVGQDYALKDARGKIWELEGYALAVDLHNKKLFGTAPDAESGEG